MNTIRDIVILAARGRAKRYISLMYGKGPMLPGHERWIQKAVGRELTEEEWTIAREAFATELDRLRPSEGLQQNARRCPDEGACHHDCEPLQCFRVTCCGPLTAYGEDWTDEVKARYGK
jgi:hypothetical protein